MAEDAIRFYARFYGFRHVIFRYGNVYGPRQDGTGNVGVVAIFAEKMRHGERPVIFGDGTKTRDYVHVADIVRLNVAALRKGGDTTVCAGSMRMIADSEAFAEVARHAAYAETPAYAPHRDGEVRRIMLANAKAKEVFGWQPRMAFETGVRRYMEGNA
jgi:UDP-glucose 4-epimerase